ncbi:MAG: hypothetical protein ACI957_004682 [Verrucomicrobiales bacterium]
MEDSGALQGALQGVSQLVLEFHLWARAGSAPDEFLVLVKAQGFTIVEVELKSGNNFGLLHAVRSH